MIRLICLIGAAAILSACAVQTSATRTGPSGLEIQITNGQNCWNNKCIRYNAARNTVSIQGRIGVPAGPIGDYVSPATFEALYGAALRAPERVSRYGDGII
ncbi:hypothetical protein AB2B41_15960 [Marimonas sp. MJW-29]|uniref:Lipoprotein n=1 Tax=Sulfitobacter sediminis TaxID=3234186 RepID=A0ABV3RQ65_9RHOB